MQNEMRYHLEQAIVGAALIESNCLHQVIHVVSHKNFSNEVYRKCWIVIERMYHKAPVDLVTFAMEARLHFPDDVLEYEASKAANIIASTAHTYSHAYKLLEEDIRDKFYQKLYQLRNDFPLSARETESIMMHLAGNTTDVFDLLNKSLEFYQRSEMESEYEILKDFEGGLLKKIARIKEMAQVDLAIEILNGVSDLPYKNTELLRLLKRGIISLCGTNQLPPNFTSDLQSLTQ